MEHIRKKQTQQGEIQKVLERYATQRIHETRGLWMLKSYKKYQKIPKKNTTVMTATIRQKRSDRRIGLSGRTFLRVESLGVRIRQSKCHDLLILDI